MFVFHEELLAEQGYWGPTAQYLHNLNQQCSQAAVGEQSEEYFKLFKFLTCDEQFFFKTHRNSMVELNYKVLSISNELL